MFGFKESMWEIIFKSSSKLFEMIDGESISVTHSIITKNTWRRTITSPVISGLQIVFSTLCLVY